ncbi:MAG: formate dehydrogenase accessory sulfurtransferase FdhD [Acetobacteraceae bacterium]|nr:formate dehydrogenase accessory sulfurtransferase FdhD [Acetobacteraceae bacterium]
MVGLRSEGDDALATWVPVRLIRGGRPVEGRDLVVRESGLRIWLDGRDLGRLQCSPLHLEEMVWGYVLSEGLVPGPGAVERVEVDAASGEARIWSRPGPRPAPQGASGGAVPPPGRLIEGPPPPGPRVSAGEVLKAMEALGRAAAVHRATGGTHCAGLARGPELLVVREDLSRWRAVDKVVGWWACGGGAGWAPGGGAGAPGAGGGSGARRAGAAAGAPGAGGPATPPAAAGVYLVASCRLSEAMVEKVARVGLGMVASRAAPTDRAVARAQELGLTLVGFARGGRLTVYAGPEGLLA